jgi:hypothetical protein
VLERLEEFDERSRGLVGEARLAVAHAGAEAVASVHDEIRALAEIEGRGDQ